MMTSRLRSNQPTAINMVFGKLGASFIKAAHLLTLTVIILAAGASTAPAQIDTGILVAADTSVLYQNGKVVGIKYVPQHYSGAKLTAEHQVLFANYQVSSARNPIRTEVVPAPELQYANEAEFFAKVPFAPGDKYVYVTKTENTKLPSQ
jgi:hypothetical protein